MIQFLILKSLSIFFKVFFLSATNKKIPNNSVDHAIVFKFLNSFIKPVSVNRYPIGNNGIVAIKIFKKK